MGMTEEEIEKFRIKEKLDTCEKELHNIELTADKSRRQRWRELNKLIKYYKITLKES
jgi:50S ribosomal subunit-associated GTPase HflX